MRCALNGRVSVLCAFKLNCTLAKSPIILWSRNLFRNICDIFTWPIERVQDDNDRFLCYLYAIIQVLPAVSNNSIYNLNNIVFLSLMQLGIPSPHLQITFRSYLKQAALVLFATSLARGEHNWRSRVYHVSRVRPPLQSIGPFPLAERHKLLKGY